MICGIHWFQSPVSAVRTEVSQWFSKFYISWIQRGQKSSLLGHTFCEYFHFIISEWQHLHRLMTKKHHAPVTLPQHMYSIVLKLYFDSEGQTFACPRRLNNNINNNNNKVTFTKQMQLKFRNAFKVFFFFFFFFCFFCILVCFSPAKIMF